MIPLLLGFNALTGLPGKDQANTTAKPRVAKNLPQANVKHSMSAFGHQHVYQLSWVAIEGN
jgi:hypothetical protein